MKQSDNDHASQTGIGERFQEETKYSPDSIGGHSLDWDHMPKPYKDYPEAISTVSLPSPGAPASANIWDVFVKRRSVRDYSPEVALPLQLLSALLVSTQGITAQEGNYGFRSAPSAGGLYPIETYLLARAVEGLEGRFLSLQTASV